MTEKRRETRIPRGRITPLQSSIPSNSNRRYSTQRIQLFQVASVCSLPDTETDEAQYEANFQFALSEERANRSPSSEGVIVDKSTHAKLYSVISRHWCMRFSSTCRNLMSVYTVENPRRIFGTNESQLRSVNQAFRIQIRKGRGPCRPRRRAPSEGRQKPPRDIARPSIP